MRILLLCDISCRSTLHFRKSISNAPRLCFGTPGRHRRCIHRPTSEFENVSRVVSNDALARVPTDDDFLRRASKYGIQSLQELDRQGWYQNRKDESQLIQSARFRSDLQLWQLLLDYQAHLYGCRGVASIYQLLKYQGPIVRLPDESEPVSTLWKQMIAIAALAPDSSDLLNRLCERDGIAWCQPKLFAEAAAILLDAGNLDKALLMCDKLQEKSHSKLSIALDIIRAFQPEKVDDFAKFLVIYQGLQPLKMYEHAMELMWQSGRKQEAVVLHSLLVATGDLPSSFHNIESLMVHLTKSGQDPGPIISQLTAAGVDYSHKAWLVNKTIQQGDSADEKVGPTTDFGQARIGSNRLSDSFVAKAFATKALPFEFVLNSLKAFGLTEVGPQTVREIGLVAKDLETLKHRLDILHERGIDTGASAYVRTIRRLCKKGQAKLLTEVLKTDIHHDVFEDRHLQWHLISDCLQKCNWSRVNLLLTILCQGAVKEQAADIAKSALLLRPTLTGNRHRAFLNFALQTYGSYKLSEGITLKSNVKSMIYEMRVQKQNRFTPYQQLEWARFVAGLMQEAVLGGQSFEVFEWRHVISRIGGRGMPDLAIGLIYWIVRLQHERIAHLGLMPMAPGLVTDASVRLFKRLSNLPAFKPPDLSINSRPTNSGTPAHLTKRLVDTRFQQSLMHWSLQSTPLEGTLKSRESWRNCLDLLRLLEQKYATTVDLKALQRVIVIWCRHLRPKRYRPKSEHNINTSQQSVAQVSWQKSREMNKAAWRQCSRIIGELHNLWSVSPEDRSADLDVAFELLFAAKARFTRPFKKGRKDRRAIEGNYDYD